MREIAHTIALTLPTTHLSYFDVPFKALRNCLPDGHVDLLWTNSSVRHTEVDTFALPLTTERIGIVGPGHMLADAAEITVEEFADNPIFYNPDAPEAWMTRHWLADLRARREARLVAIDARHTNNVFDQAGSPGGALVMGAMDQIELPRSSHMLKLLGASPITFHIAKRAADRRPAVRTIVELLQRRPAAKIASHTPL
jgi:hypothetical protein